MLKKRLVVSFFFVFFSSIFNFNVYAKSGCCSSHGGVDCSAGKQSNGKVICNDGWRGSSCLYSEMVMCGGSSYTTTTTRTTTTIPKHTTTPKPTYISTPKPTYTSTPKPTKTQPTLEITSKPATTTSFTENSEEESSGSGGAAILSLAGGIIYLFRKLKK